MNKMQNPTELNASLNNEEISSITSQYFFMLLLKCSISESLLYPLLGTFVPFPNHKVSPGKQEVRPTLSSLVSSQAFFFISPFCVIDKETKILYGVSHLAEDT